MPRLIVPSNGGGTKLTRTLLADEAEGVCAGAGEGVPDSSGEIERAGDSSDVTEAIGLGDSCAAATEVKRATRNAKLTLVVMSRNRDISDFSEREHRQIPRLRSE